MALLLLLPSLGRTKERRHWVILVIWVVTGGYKWYNCPSSHSSSIPFFYVCIPFPFPVWHCFFESSLNPFHFPPLIPRHFISTHINANFRLGVVHPTLAAWPSCHHVTPSVICDMSRIFCMCDNKNWYLKDKIDRWCSFKWYIESFPYLLS